MPEIKILLATLKWGYFPLHYWMDWLDVEMHSRRWF